MKLYYIIHTSRNYISYPFLTYEAAKKDAEQSYNFGYKIVSVNTELVFEKTYKDHDAKKIGE